MTTTYQIQHALATEGWQVGAVVENALTVEGKQFDVTRLQAHNTSLRASIVILRNVEDRIEQLERYTHTPPYAWLRVGTTSVSVQVTDHERARNELAALDPARGYSSLATLQTAVEQRGWKVVHSRDDEWDFYWSIEAECDGDIFRLHVAFNSSHRSSSVIEVDSLGFACFNNWSVHIRSARLAERLAASLAPELA